MRRLSQEHQNILLEETIPKSMQNNEEYMKEESGSVVQTLAISDLTINMTSIIPGRHPEYIHILLNLLVNNFQLTTMQYNSVISYLSKQRNEQVKRDFGEDASKPLCICGGRPINIFDLPELVLRHVFSFLPAKDLVNVQGVCKLWKALTMDTLLWKHAPVYVDSEDQGEPFKMLPYVPYLHTIAGYCEDGSEFFEAVVNNVIDLRRLECSVYCFSGGYFDDFLKKFKNIEYVEVNNDCSSDFIGSLDILGTCPYLKGLSFLFYEDDEEEFLQVCNAIGNGFFALRELSLSRIHGGGYPNAMLDMLQKKIHQLTHLSLYQDICTDVLEIIFRSSRLEKLELVNLPEITLNLGNMINLKSLTLRFTQDNSYSSQPENCAVNANKVLIFPQNLECLIFSFADHEGSREYKGIISNVTSSLPHLRTLDIGCIIDHDIDQQLEKISDLKHLHTVNLHHCPHFTAKGMEYVAKCTGLRRLEISDLTFTDSTYECLKNCTYLADLDIRTCVVNLDKLLPTILSLNYLTNMRILNCSAQSDGKQLKDSVVRKIIHECRREKHYVNIKY